MTRAIYRTEADLYLPGPESRATWYADAQHGGPVAALFAREFERVPSAVPMMVARLTVDLMRPIPARPLQVRSRTVRDGRRIQVVEAQMIMDGAVMARASALKMRTGDVGVPDHPRRGVPPGPDLGDVVPMEPAGERFFHTTGIEVRTAERPFSGGGPAAAWFRLVMPLVEGEEPSALQRTVAVADFGNGISRVLGRGYVFMNADLTVHLHRYQTGEWVCLRARSDIESSGVGLAQSEVFDEQGSLGHALQSLYVDTRERFDKRSGCR